MDNRKLQKTNFEITILLNYRFLNYWQSINLKFYKLKKSKNSFKNEYKGRRNIKKRHLLFFYWIILPSPM